MTIQFPMSGLGLGFTGLLKVYYWTGFTGSIGYLFSFFPEEKRKYQSAFGGERPRVIT